MQVMVVDKEAKTREVVVGRVREALRQAGLRRADVVEGDFDLLIASSGREAPSMAFLGPGYYDQLENSVSRFRSFYPRIPLAIVLDNAIYAAEAIELRRLLSTRILAIADVAQMAQFILDGSGQAGQSSIASTQGVIACTQLKGGVGTTTVAAGLAECWAAHELTVALVDLDDVNPQLTDWSKVPGHQRKLISEMLRQGAAPFYRVSEFVTPTKRFGERLVVVGLPELYQESFHYKADVLDGAPSAADFIRSLVHTLQQQYDVVVLDLGRSWGVGAFAALTLSQHVLLNSTSELTGISRTLRGLYRLYRESEDVAEFDFAKWRLVLNEFVAKPVSRDELRKQLEESDLLDHQQPITFLPRSESGRNWAMGDDGIYSLGEAPLRATLEDLSFSMVPYRTGRETERRSWGILQA